MRIEEVLVKRIMGDPLERLRLRGWFRQSWIVDPILRGIYKGAMELGEGREVTEALFRDIFIDRLSSSLSKEDRKAMAEVLKGLEAMGPPADGDYHHAVDRVMESALESAILTNMNTVMRGFGEQELSEKVRRVREFPRFLDAFTRQAAQEGDGRTMKDLEQDPRKPEYGYGFRELDRAVTGGSSRGDLVLWLARPGHYKTALGGVHTSLLAYTQGKNVLYVTFETSWRQIQRVFLTQHANRLTPRAVRAHAVQSLEFVGESERVAFDRAVQDFDQNPEYGKLKIWSPPPKTSILDVEEYARAVHRGQFPLDIVVVDHAQQVYRIEPKRSRDEEVGETATAAKQFARTFDRGVGVLVLMPWQATRSGYLEALKKGYYDMDALAQSAEAERNADVVLWSLLKPSWRKARQCKVGCAKNRWGDVVETGVKIYSDGEFGIFDDLTVEESKEVDGEVGRPGLGEEFIP